MFDIFDKADRSAELKKEIMAGQEGEFCGWYYRSVGYGRTQSTSSSKKRADGIYALFTEPEPHIYKNDLIVGSWRPLFHPLSGDEKKRAAEAARLYPERWFMTNSDHFAPDYETILSLGIRGMLSKISESEKNHSGDSEKTDFLQSMKTTILALQHRIRAHAAQAEKLVGVEGYDHKALLFIKNNCEAISENAPTTFAQGLQLVWMIHSCFMYEGRYAMALGRLDQFLYPLYLKDVERGSITKSEVVVLFENVFTKIGERRTFFGADDVVNICVGGVDVHGKCAVNDLSYCIVEAVKNIQIPGPNLTARINPETPDEFLDECLKAIGTGLGYPALANDIVNMEALKKYGYAKEDVRNYSMVGCIENFITGMQPPWTDGRFDVPRFLEYLFFEGKGYSDNATGIRTAPLREITSMELFMENIEKQLSFGVSEYIKKIRNVSLVPDPENYTSPFLSCFCRDCIDRGKDINMGGSRYPSVHGVALMGVGTMSDSLSAIEKVVFIDKCATLENVAEALKCNFEGDENKALRQKLLDAPKYGNNDEFVDKYAVWFTSFLADEFSKYKTPDGGGVYVAMAANVSNIYAGKLIGATPDGRLAGEPLSDAASPTYGRDVKGATSTLLSVAKPDYTRCACGTVVNQKFSPSMFKDGKREKLLKLIRVYFSKGGQEIQINSTSPEVLKDAMEHPELYGSLVVRVSGFSAFYVTLQREVQEDILSRTQQE